MPWFGVFKVRNGLLDLVIVTNEEYKVSYPTSWRLCLQQGTRLGLRVALGGEPVDLHGKVWL